MKIENYICDFHINKAGRHAAGQVIRRNPVLNDFNASTGFHRSLPDYAPSPLISLPGLSDQLGVGSIQVKDEGQRFGIPAIKLLGASFAVARLLETDPAIITFCSATDGNHGKGVAWACRHFGRKAVIFVPGYTVTARINAIQNLGAQVIVVEGNYDMAVETAKRYAHANQAVLVQDTSWDGYSEIPALITAGYYTQMTELLMQIGDSGVPDLVILQAGVGTWPSAVAHFMRNMPVFENTRIVCAEPFNSDCFLESAKQGRRSATVKSQQTIMAGLNCGTPSLLAWELLKHATDIFISIADNYALEAMHTYYHPIGSDPVICAGESGAAGLAALLAIIRDERLLSVRKELEIGKTTNVLLFNTENITDPEFFKQNVE